MKNGLALEYREFNDPGLHLNRCSTSINFFLTLDNSHTRISRIANFLSLTQRIFNHTNFLSFFFKISFSWWINKRNNSWNAIWILKRWNLFYCYHGRWTWNIFVRFGRTCDHAKFSFSPLKQPQFRCLDIGALSNFFVLF